VPASGARTPRVQLPADLLSQIKFKCSCHEDFGIKLNFSQIPAQMPYRKAMVHFDEFRLTSARVYNLLDRVSELDWKNQFVTHHNTHSVLLYLFVTVTLIYGTIKLYFMRAGGLLVARIWGKCVVRTWRYPRLPKRVWERTPPHWAVTAQGICRWRLNPPFPHLHMFHTHV
jgi:hypothetical protein